MQPARKLLIYCPHEPTLEDWRLALRYHRYRESCRVTELFCHSRLEFALAAIKYELPDAALLLRPSAEIKPIIESMGEGKCVIVASQNHFWEGDSTIVVPESVPRYQIVCAINEALVKKRGPKPGWRNNEAVPLTKTQYASA